MRDYVLDYVTKLMQPSLRGRVQEYVRTCTTSGSIIVELDPTTACNFACPECINMPLLNKGSIPITQITALIDEFRRAEVKGVIFIGGGEPLVYKGMPAPIMQCHEYGIAVGLTTNGSLIKRHLQVISECVSWTRVSVDAASQETFSMFRPSTITNSFQRVRDNIERLAKSKKGKLGYSFLLIERDNLDGEVVTNVHEVYEAAHLARELGCDYFEYKPMVDEHHNLIPLSNDVRKELAEQVEKVQELNTETFSIIVPNSIPHLLNGTRESQPKDYTTCPTLELRTLITPTGIYPCPYKRGCEGVRLGNIDVRFDEYWTSNKRCLLAVNVNPSRDCPFYCIRHDMNILLLLLAQAYANGTDLLSCMNGTEVGDVFI